jgi:D-alanyl-lipoteichoic acid acyltransferase DltB (MBOAT superfamily)
MFSQVLYAAEIVGYIMAGRAIVRRLSGGWREFLFALLNMSGVYLFFFQGADRHLLPTFLAYLFCVLVQYGALRLWAKTKGALPWMAFFAPILFLIIVRYAPDTCWSGLQTIHPAFFIGISYLAFRASHLVLEVRNGVAPLPGIWEYLGFCFFVPIIPVGPINPYSNHRRGFDANKLEIPIPRAAMRVLVGFVKYKFIGSICFQLSYGYLLFDDHYHHWIDLAVAMIFYYLFLYCNFSGFCDMAIGAAGLMGIPVAENFDNPFAARNVKDFWNRWHITLSQYMRDVVFAPLSKFLVRLTGPANANHAIAITIIAVFLLVGIWHGVGWNFAAYGAAHALGVVVNHYYTIWLKKRLGREGFKAYNSNRWIRATAITLTFTYCEGTLFLFANTFPEMKRIFSILK